MKRFTKTFMVALGFGALLAGCQPEPVGPDGRGDKHIAGAVSEEHPNLDTICAFADSVYLRAANGSYEVDICNDGDIFTPVAIPCVGPQPKWGSFVMYNGYEYVYDSVSGTTDSIHQLDVDFSLAPGVVCDFTNWLFTVNNTILLDQNTNLPIVGTDWSSLVVNPSRNEWRVRTLIADLPSPCFDLACRINAVQLSLFGDPIPGTEVTLWAINQHWNQTGHPAASNNEYAIRYCPLACLENITPQCPTTQTSSECEVVYKGITCTGNTLNTTTLTASNAGITGNASYAWSNGATTQSITVTPNVTTNYTVTVTSGACTIRIVTFNVNVIDVACTITTSGGGSGNGGSGSGNSGSHHPGCNHNHSSSTCNGGNHQYGCNAAHSGGNTNCNHRGHGRNCSTTHAASRACGGGHTRGCNGNHTASQTCQSGGGHRYNCNGQHNVGTSCNSLVAHAIGCSQNHAQYRGCNGSGTNGSNGSGNGSGNSGSNSGSGSGNGGGTTTTPGVKICHVPPGNPNGAATVCVSYAQLSQHLTGVCGGGSTSGNGGSGSGNGGSGSGSGNSGSGNSGSGNGGSGSGNGGSCSHHGGQSGCGTGNGSGHSGDYLGACNSNPCN